MTEHEGNSGLRPSYPHRVNPYLWEMQRVADPAGRIFLFPFAGGSAHFFQSWVLGHSAAINLWAIELPGRADRFREPPFRRLDLLVATLADHLEPFMNGHFAFFGHSMGALIAFELARELRRRKLSGPTRLFLSGRRAAHLPSRTTPVHTLNNSDLRAELRRMGGTPAAVLESRALIDLLIPLIRADFEVSETYSYRRERPLEIPIRALAGDEDPYATIEELSAWAMHTTQSAPLKTFPGDHFFLFNHVREILRIIHLDLQEDRAVRNKNTYDVQA